MPQTNSRMSQSATFAFCVFALFACTFGCNRSKPAKSDDLSKAPERKLQAELESTAQSNSNDQSEPAEAQPKDTKNSQELAELEVTSDEPTKPQPRWSVQRWIALAPDGPIVIDMAANIGGEDLEQASQKAIQTAIDQISIDLPRPWSWDAILDHKLIRSGWLGNLIPDGNQRSQVTGMYNSNGDEEVQDAEFTAFLTRGLSRSSPLRFNDIGFEPNSDATTKSPWGKLDTDKDNQLSTSEIASLVENAMRSDTNGDHTITLQELRPTPPAPNMSNDGGMLDATTTVAIEKKNAKRVGRLVLEHYTFLDSISRDQFSGVSDSRWNELDSNHDMKISQSELERLNDIPCDLRIETAIEDHDADSTHLTAKSDRPGFEFNSRLPTQGQVNGQRTAIGIVFNDNYTSAFKKIFQQQLSAAFENAQLQMFLRNQLQLGENAFEVLDEDGNKKLSDAEFEKAWQWTTASRSNRLILRWMIVAQDAWFNVADADSDKRVTEMELQNFSNKLQACDSDKDGIISVSEMPFVAKLEINRTDARFQNNNVESLAQPPTSANVAVDWFSANDSNADGFVSKLEFLGSSEDFAGYDRDNDGFISRQETYEVK